MLACRKGREWKRLETLRRKTVAAVRPNTPSRSWISKELAPGSESARRRSVSLERQVRLMHRQKKSALARR